MNNVTALEFLKILSENKVDFSICRVNEDSSMVKMKNSKLVEKHSASPSQNIFGDLLYETLNSKSEIPVSLKVFVDLESLWEHQEKKTEYQKLAIMSVGGLMYEALVYDKILRTIIERRESPNFINFIGYAECRAEDILQNISPGKRVLVKESFLRYGVKITNDTKMGVLITEKAGNGAAFLVEDMNLPVTTMEKFADAHANEPDIMNPVIFQIVYSLEVMQRHKITHNDLHCGNILLMTLPEPISMTFNLDDKIYRITTEHIPLLFDWDRAYAASLGDNPRLNENVLEQNKFTKKGDLYTFLCTLYEDTDAFFQEYKDAMIKEEEILALDPTRNQILALANLSPYAKTFKGSEIYKLSGRQFREIFGDHIIGENVISVMVEVSTDNTVSIHYGHGCRPSLISTNFPTPLEYIGKHFSNFITEIPADEYSDFFIYTAPENEEQPAIIIDKRSAQSGREKIQGKPRFPPQESGYVRKDDSYPDTLLIEFERPREIRVVTADPDNLELLESNVNEMRTGIDILKKIVPYEHYLLCVLNNDLSYTLGLSFRIEEKSNSETTLIEKAKRTFLLNPERKKLNLIYQKGSFSFFSINIRDCKDVEFLEDENKEENLAEGKTVALAVHGTKKDIITYMKRNFSGLPHKTFGVLAVKLLDIN